MTGTCRRRMSQGPAFALLMTALAAVPAAAQIDVSGRWYVVEFATNFGISFERSLTLTSGTTLTVAAPSSYTGGTVDPITGVLHLDGSGGCFDLFTGQVTIIPWRIDAVASPDGASFDGTFEESIQPTLSARTGTVHATRLPATCGNGVVDPGEACDRGLAGGAHAARSSARRGPRVQPAPASSTLARLPPSVTARTRASTSRNPPARCAAWPRMRATRPSCATARRPLARRRSLPRSPTSTTTASSTAATIASASRSRRYASASAGSASRRHTTSCRCAPGCGCRRAPRCPIPRLRGSWSSCATRRRHRCSTPRSAGVCGSPSSGRDGVGAASAGRSALTNRSWVGSRAYGSLRCGASPVWNLRVTTRNASSLIDAVPVLPLDLKLILDGLGPSTRCGQRRLAPSGGAPPTCTGPSPAGVIECR